MPKQEETDYEKMVEDIAVNIEKLSKQVTKLLNGRLNRKAIVILLAYTSGLGQGVINQVLHAIEDLEGKTLKKKK